LKTPGIMRNISLNAVLFILFLFSDMLIAEAIFSPDRHIVVNCNLRVHDEPYPSGLCFYFNVQYKGIMVVNDSPLGLEFAGQKPFLTDWRIYNVKKRIVTEQFQRTPGSAKIVDLPCNEAVYQLQESKPPFRLLNIHFRVYDSGIAFRYEIPTQSGLDKLSLTKEKTTFFLPMDITSYALQLASYQTSYASNYKIDQLGADTLLGLPLLLDSGLGSWMMFSEAGVHNYPRLFLRPSQKERQQLLSVDLADRLDNPDIKARHSLPFLSPWRVIALADQPGCFMESDLIQSLNQPCQIDDRDWVKPGKCVWPGWTNFHVSQETYQGSLNKGTIEHYLKFAAENHFEYLLIDAGWYGNPDNKFEDISASIPALDLLAIIATAKKSGVKLFLWINSQCAFDQIETVFPLYEKWGIAGVMIGKMHRYDQEIVNLQHMLLQRAAEFHLMVVFQDAGCPDGIRRTYPNLITRGAVLGLEYSKFSDKCNPDHDLILPFTRQFAGPMNYGTGCFRTVMKEQFSPDSIPPVGQGTRAHQLAMYVVYDSPLQMVSDYPAAYQHGKGLDFIRNVPTVWDSTGVLEGVVGESITVIRKVKDEYYLGIMTNWTQRGLKVPLTFLGSGKYRAEIFSDGPNTVLNPCDVQYRSIIVDSASLLAVHLGSGGGYVARFIPESKESLNSVPK